MSKIITVHSMSAIPGLDPHLGNSIPVSHEPYHTKVPGVIASLSWLQGFRALVNIDRSTGAEELSFLALDYDQTLQKGHVIVKRSNKGIIDYIQTARGLRYPLQIY